MPFSMTSLFQRLLGLLVLVLVCGACTTPPPVKKVEPPPVQEIKVVPEPVDPARVELTNGVASYENGNYKDAAQQLQKALALGLKGREEQANAHKYQAFMHCVGGRKKLCREEFKQALAADATFELTPAEAGHPTWGPIFSKLKKSHKPASK